MLILSQVTDNYRDNYVPNMGIKPAKLPNIRLGMLQKTGLKKYSRITSIGFIDF